MNSPEPPSSTSEPAPVFETALDWGLSEALGTAKPPDLVAGVRARLEEAAMRPAAARDRLGGNARRVATAAALLIGTAVVIWIASILESRGPTDRGIGRSGAAIERGSVQDPEPSQVGSREQIEALPLETTHVIATGLDDGEVPALLRLRNLHTLELAAVWPSPMGPETPLRPMGLLSDAALGFLASMGSLRSLHLDSQIEITAEGLAQLEHLSKLEQLSLTYSIVADGGLAFLERMPALRTLQLSACSQIGSETLEQISQLDSLRTLSLRACGQLESQWLARLGRMRHLQTLDLAMIGSRTYFSGFSPIAVPEPGSGVTEDVVHALSGMESLEVLDLAYAEVTVASLGALQGLPLAQLDLTGVDLDAAPLPRTLTSLVLCGAQKLPVDLGAALAESSPSLTRLRVSHSSAVDDDLVESLDAMAKLEDLDVAYCRGLTEACVEQLERLRLLRRLDVRGLTFIQEPQLVRLRRLPLLERLFSDHGEEVLR